MPDCYYDMIYGGHSGAIDGDEIASDEDNSVVVSLEARIRDEVSTRLQIETKNFKSLSRACAHKGDDINTFFGNNYDLLTAHSLAWQSSGAAKGGQCCVEQVFSACGLTLTNGRAVLDPTKFECLIMIKQNHDKFKPKSDEIHAEYNRCVKEDITCANVTRSQYSQKTPFKSFRKRKR